MAQTISNNFKKATLNLNSGLTFKTLSADLSSIKLSSPRGGFDLAVEMDAIFNTKGQHGYSLNANKGGFHVNVEDNINLNTNNDINILSEKGNLNVDSNNNISLHTENEIILTTTNGNGVINVGNNINLNSGENIDLEAINGKFELDAQKEIKINTKDTIKGIMIGTTTEGVPIMIGSETSIVTIARDGLIFNDILYNNSVIPVIGKGVSNSQCVEWINHGKISNMSYLQLFISLAGLYENDGVIGNLGSDEAHFGYLSQDLLDDIFSIKIECVETPMGGNPSISFRTSTSKTTLDIDSTNMITNQWGIDSSRYVVNLPRKDTYLYLTTNINDMNDKRMYTAGKFILTFWSK